MRIQVNKTYIIFETQEWCYFINKETFQIHKAYRKNPIKEYIKFEHLGERSYHIIFGSNQNKSRYNLGDRGTYNMNINIKSDRVGHITEYQDNLTGDWWSKEVFTIPLPYEEPNYAVIVECFHYCRGHMRELFWKYASENMDVRRPLEYKIAMAVDMQLKIMLDLQQPNPTKLFKNGGGLKN